VSQDGTTSVDYGQDYYNEAHLGGHGDYCWDNEDWRNFFMSVADRLIGAFNPGSVLDVGCARGLLVQSFTVQGVEAWGLDISAHAIASAHEDVRDRLRVASATDPIEGHYDLVTCIEVLEHMSEADAQERRVPTLHELVKGYEQQYARTRTELLEKRRALLEADREINALRGRLDERPVDTEEVDRLRAEVAQHRHASLVSRDHVIGLEAENGRLERDLSLVMLELRKLQRRVKGLTKRREELTANLRDTRQRLERNRKRVAQLEAAPAPQASLTRRVARRVRRTFA
jgi:SAM-dependent methyltransferase